MPRPTLQTERLTLVPLRNDAEHLELLVALDSDPEVMRYLKSTASTRDEVVAAHARRTDLALDEVGQGYWLGFAGEVFIGWWGLAPVGLWGQGTERRGVEQTELGYRLMRAQWGKGFATEGSRALLDYAFDVLEMQRVFATTMTVNAGSQRVMERLGMTYVRTFHPTFDDPVPGTEHGEVEYAIERPTAG